MNSKTLFKTALILLAALFFYGLQPATAQAQSGSVNWNGWTLDYEIGIYNDGLAIENVEFEGKKIMGRGNFPAMPVYYQNNSCGPYLDRLDTDLVAVPWANNASVVSRQFNSGGEQWYELGIRQFIGQYDIYQVWYFNGNGIIDAHLFSRGLQCNVFHEHWPQWRFDFDIAGSGNDQILRQTATGLQAYTTEFNVPATSATNHGWVIRDTVTNDSVELSFDSGEWTPSGTIVPETVYAKNRVAGRSYRAGEQDWHTSGHASLPANWNNGVDRIGYGNGENINDTDIVLWYSGYLPHSSTDGASLWHSTGVRITVQNDGITPAPTNTPPPLTATSTPRAGTVMELINTEFTSGASGFSYRDNTFGTGQGAYASGIRIASGAYNGSAGLQVLLGGLDNNIIVDMSGGWAINFNVPSSAPVDLSFRYKITQNSEYENDEYSQVMASVDGVRYGSNGNNYIQRITGNGNGGLELSTGWQTYSVNLGTLSAGNHSLIIGGYNNKKTYNDELTTILFDDVVVTADLPQQATNTPVPTATNTPIPTATNTPTSTATNTPTSTATNTPAPTAIDTPAPVVANTPIPAVTPIPTPSNQLLRGDVSCDNVVNAVDALFILQLVVGNRTDVGSCPLSNSDAMVNSTVGDVNGLNGVDSVDALFILQCEVGNSNSFCP